MARSPQKPGRGTGKNERPLPSGRPALRPEPTPRRAEGHLLGVEGKGAAGSLASEVSNSSTGAFGTGTYGSGPYGGSPINARVDAELGAFTLNAAATTGKKKRVVVIRDKRQVLLQSSILINALQEAYDYKYVPGKNEPPPDLAAEFGLSDPKARSEIGELIVELKKLNAFLEAHKKKPSIAAKPIVDVRKQVDKLLTKYGGTVSKGAGFLTVGLIGELAISLGADSTMVYASLAGFFWKAR